MKFKNLSRQKKALYRLACRLGLTEFHWAGAQILLSVNGYDNAEGYLLESGQPKQQQMKF